MSGLRRLRVRELHPNLLCILCGGYYVDATTIVECLHSFCKTCIVRYLESSKFCPICDVQVHKTKPLLSIRPDKTLQDIVYKLVPGLYPNEMCKRREFYSSHPETPPATPEDGGSDLGRWYTLPDDPVSLALYPALASSTSPHLYLKNHLLPDTPHHGSLKTHSRSLHERPLENRVRYLQCPAGVSVAQLKRLIRAKFGVGPSHPMALLTGSSEDPLHDSLTLVDVAYITSWQRTEPLQLLYRIYEKASKKIKLDPETCTSDPHNLSEEMPKLEPSVGSGAPSCLEPLSGVVDYSTAPLLQAVGSLGYQSPVERDPSGGCVNETSVMDPIEQPSRSCEGPKLNTLQENATSGKTPSVARGVAQPPQKDSQVIQKCDPLIEETQGMPNDGGPGGVHTGAADPVVTYSGTYATPSNGVSVGVALVPGELGYLSPAGVTCAIIPSGGCIPATANIPVLCGARGEWATAGPQGGSQALGEGSPQVPGEANSAHKNGVARREEEEGEEVQLKISESGIMSVCGKDTTVEGVLNSLESEAGELLSKIESGSLGEDFPSLTHPRHSEGKKSKSKAGNVQGKAGNKIDDKGNKNQAVHKEERTSNIQAKTSIVENKKLEKASNKDSTEVSPVISSENFNEHGNVNGERHDTKVKSRDKTPPDTNTPSEHVNCKDAKDGGNKSLRASHIPASLAAASLANLNKPLLKAGTSKISQEEKLKEQKLSNNGLNAKKDANKQDMKSSVSCVSGGGCRKAPQSYSYKTLKTPPKSWNPTISREQLALATGKSLVGKGPKDPPRTNKFFKARNRHSPVEVKGAGSAQSNGSQKRNPGVVLKIDPKTLGPVSIPAKSEGLGSPTCVSLSVSTSSSTPPAVLGFPQTTVASMVVALPQGGDKCVNSTETVGGATVSVVEGMQVSTNRGAHPVSVTVSSEDKDSTNNSAKVIGTTIIQDNNNTLHNNNNNNNSNNNNNNNSKKKNNKSNNSDNIKSSKSGRSLGSSNNCNTSRNIKKIQGVQTQVSSTKNEASAQSVPKTSSGAVGVAGSAMTCLVPSTSHTTQLKMAPSSCVPQVTADVVNASPAPPQLQPQQQLTIGSPAIGVGIIPSCGVSFTGAIGTLPLPYYTSPPLGYPTYPYLYQTPETIGLMSPHTPAPFIPAFPNCLPPRSPLNTRTIVGPKMIPELPLQPSLLPMVPLVPQVPSQTVSPRPMTPPSPRTPTSTQPPRPYSTHSPRQSCTNPPSRPHTPQSPKPMTAMQSTRLQIQSPKQFSTAQSVTTQSLKLSNSNIPAMHSQFMAQPGQSEKTTLPQQEVSSHNTFSKSSPQSPMFPNSGSIYPQNSVCQLNACVQTSASLVPFTTKTVNNSVNISKPFVPQSTQFPISNQLGLCVMPITTTASLQSTVTFVSQHQKLPRPQCPQSPRPSSSVQFTSPQVSDKNSQPDALHLKYLELPSNSKTDSRKVTTNTEKMEGPRVSCSSSETITRSSSTVSTSLVASPTLAVAPLDNRELSIVSTTSFGSEYFPLGTHTSLSSNCYSVYTDSIKSTPSTTLADALLPSTVLPPTLPFPPTSLVTLPVSLASVATVTAIPTLTTCPVISSHSSNLSLSGSQSPLLASNTASPGSPPKSSSSLPSALLDSNRKLAHATNMLPSAVPSNCITATVTVPTGTTAAVTVSGNAAGNITPVTTVTLATSCSSTRNAEALLSNCTFATLPVITSVATSAASADMYLCTTASSATSLTSTASIVAPERNTVAEKNTYTSPVSVSSVASTAVSTLSVGVTQVTASCSVNSLEGSVATTAAKGSDGRGGGPDPRESNINPAAQPLAPSIPVSSSCSTTTPTTSTAVTNTPFPIGELSLANWEVVPRLQNSCSPCGTVGENSISNVMERGGCEPRSSACTPVCDVTHVIDAKQQCAEPSVSSSGGPRPCLKS